MNRSPIIGVASLVILSNICVVVYSNTQRRAERTEKAVPPQSHNPYSNARFICTHLYSKLNCILYILTTSLEHFEFIYWQLCVRQSTWQRLWHSGIRESNSVYVWEKYNRYQNLLYTFFIFLYNFFFRKVYILLKILR